MINLIWQYALMGILAGAASFGGTYVMLWLSKKIFSDSAFYRWYVCYPCFILTGTVSGVLWILIINLGMEVFRL